MSRRQEHRTAGALAVHSWKIGIGNAHLIVGRRAVLVDTGPASGARVLRRRLLAAGLEPGDLAAVILTHAHADHSGNAATFAELGVPVVLGAADADMAAAGHNPPLNPTGPAGRLLNRIVSHAFPAFAPSVRATSTVDLSPYGIDGEFRLVGGHTDGSGVVVADDSIAVGDLVRGGFLGGAVLSGVANVHYFSPDPAADLHRVAGLIDELRPRRILLGHGGPLDADSARRRIDALLGKRKGRSPRRTAAKSPLQ